MNASNFSQQREDALDDPLFIKFSKVFADNSMYRLNRKVRKFETTHLHLRLVSFDDFTRSVPVTGNYLFSDKSHQYSELLYRFKIYREIRYYEPELALAEWLAKIDEFTQLRKEKHFRKKNSVKRTIMISKNPLNLVKLYQLCQAQFLHFLVSILTSTSPVV